MLLWWCCGSHKYVWCSPFEKVLGEGWHSSYVCNLRYTCLGHSVKQCKKSGKAFPLTVLLMQAYVVLCMCMCRLVFSLTHARHKHHSAKAGMSLKKFLTCAVFFSFYIWGRLKCCCSTSFAYFFFHLSQTYA